MQRSLTFPLFFTLGAALLGCGSGAVSITEARGFDAKTEITVEGFITVPSGALESSTGDKIFAIQDDAAGIYVSVASKVDFAVGKNVEVAGTVDALNQLHVIKADPSKVVDASGQQTVAPKDLKTSAVNASTEGLLVRVSGSITKPVVDDMPYGYKVFIDDGSGEIKVFLNASAGFDATNTAMFMQGGAIKVTGFSSRYDAEFEVDPRSSVDIIAGP